MTCDFTTLRLLRTLVLWLPVALLSYTPQLARGQLALEGAVYHQATRTTYATSPLDNGGALFVFVRNNSAETQTFTNGAVTLNGAPVGSYSTYDWSRVWPISVAPGEVATLTLKGNGGPFAPGQNVNVSLVADSGATLAVNNLALNTPQLRVANVVPSKDLTRASVFLRNDDSSPYQIDSLFLNDDVTSLSRFVGGSTTIAPNSIKIVEVDFGVAQRLLTPYAVRVEATRLSDSSSVLTGAPVRLTEAILPTSSWQADLAISDVSMRDARIHYGHELHGATSRFPGTMATRLENYSIRGLHIDVLDFPGNDINTVEYRDFTTGVPGGVPYQAPLFELPEPVAAQANNPAIYGWYVRDEPDLNTSNIRRNPQAMWRLNDTYWRNSDKPTFLNLVADGSVQRYGLISDHPAIDRYMQVAPLSDSRANRNIDQVLQYADSMKNNVEPLRMWWITQGVSDAWGGSQPTTWGIDVQFWSALMGGAKGMMGFMLDNREATHPALHAKQVEVVHELQIVRNLILYGETLANTTLKVGGTTVNQSAVDITAAARSIISEDAVILPIANLTGRQPTFGSPVYDVLNNVTVDVTIPDWIDIGQVKRVTQNGFLDVTGGFSYSRDGQQLTITIDQLHDTDVFIISKLDTLAPVQVENLRLVNNSFLSWDEPHDNFGVHGYHVIQDDLVIATVPTPIYHLTDFDPTTKYQIRAFDASMNLGAASVPLGSIVSRWDGNNPLAGEPGDGVSWNDARNWTRENVVDAGFATNTVVTFAAGSTQSVINLQQNRSVTSVNFQGSYTLQGFTLAVISGEIAVQQGAASRITSILSTPATAWKKTGSGIFRFNGVLSKNLTVEEGVYSGTSTNQTLTIAAGAVLQPGDPTGILRVNGALNMLADSRLRIPIPTNGQAPGILAFSNVNVQSGALLEVTLGGFVPQAGYSRQIMTILGGGQLVGEFGLELPDIGSDLAWNVIQNPAAGNVVLSIVWSADFNGDGIVDANDFDIWSTHYGTTEGASRSVGDANGDGKVDGADFMLWQRQLSAQNSSTAVVPEPAGGLSALIACCGGLGLGNCRRLRRSVARL